MAEPSAPFGAVTWPVRTQRLELRPAVAADAAAAWNFRRLPAVAEWLTTAHTDPTSFAEYFAEPTRLAKTLVVTLRSTPELVIGDLMLAVNDAWAQGEVADGARQVQAEVGYAFDPEHAGQGYATEAVAALIELCFASLGLRRVTAECFADNEPSWRLMERIGMRREAHTVSESLHRTRGWLDGLSYAILADEWPSLR